MLGSLVLVAMLFPGGAIARKSGSKKCSHRGAAYFSPGYKGLCSNPKLGPQPVLPPIPLGDNGRSPQVLVDAAGTAHIVWNQDGGDGPDQLRYCRLKRGATACDNPPASLAPDQPGPFNNPAFNEDIAGPRILQIANGLIFLTHRYPNIVPKPDGTESDRTTYMYVSDDGGQTITGPAIVGDAEPSGGAAVFGDGSRIGLISDTRTGGTYFQAIDPGSYTSAEANLGGNGPDRAYSGSVVPAGAGGAPTAAYADLAGTTFIRQWQGTGDIADPGTWAEGTTPGVDPRLASGPAGAYLANAPTDARDKIQVRPLNGVQVGNGPTINTGHYSARDFLEDPSGALRVGWVNGVGAGSELLESVAGSGLKFDAGNAVARADVGLDDIDLGAASDGGGFAVYTAGGSSQGYGKIFASGFGNQAPTGLPGLGNVPGGGSDPDVKTSCKQISYKAVEIRNEFCFWPVQGKPGFKVTKGAFKLNGLEIIPDADVKVEMSTKSGPKTIDSVGGNGKVTVQLDTPSGPIVLWHGELHIQLPTGGAGSKLFSVDLAKFAPKIKGFPVSGDFDLILKEKSIEIPLQLKLPSVFGGLSGSATLRADNDHGLDVDSVRFVVPKFVLGPLELDDIEAAWTGSTDTWTGGGGARFLGAGMSASVTFAGGKFQEGFLKVSPVPFPGIKIAPDVFINSVSARLHLATDTSWFEGSALFGVQPLAPPDTYVYTVRGTLRATITPKFAMDYHGEGAISGIPVSDAKAHGDIDGYFTASGNVMWDIEAVSGKGTFDGHFDASSGSFGGSIDSTVTIGKTPHLDAGILLYISNEAAYGCYKSIGGFGYNFKTQEVIGPTLFSCPDEPPAPAGKAAQVHTSQQGFTLPAGLPSVSLKVVGTAGAPAITLVSPSGTPVPLTPADAQGAATAPAVVSTTDTSVLIGLHNPAAGSWRIDEATPASVARVDVARERPPLDVSAKVKGHGRKRVLTYKTTRRDGLLIRFSERVGAGTHQLRAVKSGSGKFRFTAGDGPGGRRAIVAQAEQNGLPVLQQSVASYRAPGPIRPNVRGLKARRAGKKVVVRWRRALGAKDYLVRFDSSDGRHLLQVTSGTKARLGKVGKGDRVRVRVYGRSTHGRLGRAARAQVRAKRKRH
jgi:hypothetical protein